MASELKVDTIKHTNNTSAITLDASGNITLNGEFSGYSHSLSHRNMVINGAMQVAQRGNVTGKTSATYGGPDRFKTEINALGTWSISQNTTNTPTDKGFKNSLKLEITANAESSIGGASDYVNLQQRFEGQDLQHIRKGTSEAKQVTLSFWVKSNVTGNYNIELTDVDNSRHVTALSTIDSADTWEYKTHTFPADTTGAFDNDNGQSLRVLWWLATGTTFTSGSRQTTWGSTSNGDRGVGNANLASANNNYYEITGVQLELGSKATPFEHRSFADDLRKCERYYQNSFNDGNIPGTSTSLTDSVITTGWNDGNAPFANPFRTVMRSAPSATIRPRNSTTTGQINNGGTFRTAVASDIGNKGVSYIAVTSGTANVYNAYSYELNAEL
tara:strand:- start:460 stop:1617 length:1158 start_codon:yes stop_codon:yes gene_type:complete